MSDGGPHWRDRGALDAGGLRAAATRAASLPDEVAVPELVRLARAAQLASEFVIRSELLAQVERRRPDALDLVVEQALDAARDGEVDRADELADGVLARAGLTAVLRGRALLAKGTAACWRGGSAAKLSAEALLGEAAELLAECGEPEWAADALLTRAMKVAYANGDLEAAVDGVARALALQPEPTRVRGTTLSFHATALAMVGRADEAEVAAAEGTAIGRLLGDHRIRAYNAWAAAYPAALRQDAATLVEALHDVERHPGDWYAGPVGAEFLAAAADLLGRIGSAEALAWLGRAEAAAERVGYPEIALLARAGHEARVGDPLLATELLARLPDSEEVPPREHWRLLLLRARVAQRTGDTAEAAALLARSRASATRMGVPTLPELVEPVVTAVLTGTDPGEDTTSVHVLGGFAVVRGGTAVEITTGQARGLVTHLAVGGGERTVEEVIEAFWPDQPPEPSRVRLRNLLYRLRREAGDLVLRDGEVLRLDATVDLAGFERAARGALSASGAEQDRLVDEALALYTGEVAPADRYQDWSVVARERARRLQLSVLDLAVRMRVRQDRADEALGLLELAIESEPLDEARYRLAADLARRQGHEATARRYEARSADVRRELGLA